MLANRGSSEEGLTELRIRRSYGPILFADVRGTIPKQAVEINKEFPDRIRYEIRTANPIEH